MINGRKIVALCTCRIYESQEFVFISEFNKRLLNEGYYLFIYALNSEIGNSGDEVPETAVFDLIPYEKTDIVVIMDEKIKSREIVQQIIDRAKDNSVPVVVIDGEYEGVSEVSYDYSRGFEDVVRHMIEYHGIRRPHFMAGKKYNPFSGERIDVFKKVIAENGIPFDDSMVSYGDFWAVPSRAATKELLKRDELPEAIICANDIMAINVCDVLGGAGVSVPKDVLVSGFDGIDEAFLSKPGITTASCDSVALASAVRDVVQRVLAGETEIDMKVVPGFIANESCGCPKSNKVTDSVINGLNNNFYHHQDDIHAMHLITSKIMIGKDMEENINYVKNNLAKYACIVIEDSCFDLENNFYFDDNREESKTVVYDSYSDSNDYYQYDPDTVIPHIEEIMEKNMPLIFNGLEYMGKCPGFVCYSFPRIELIDFDQTPNLTNCFGMGIGGYAINKYQKYLHEKLQKMYQNDALTGLYNRLAFVSRYDDMLGDSANYGKKVTVFMADLNGLKKINDTFGHLAGDRAIAAVASAMRRACPPDAMCVRIGGDEMLALILGDHECDTVISDIERFLEQDSRELGFRVSASIGTYSTVFDKELDLSKIIGYADAQMYEVKRKTKGQ
jgi:diguanylate cyclase (GGDEF)-like protein